MATYQQQLEAVESEMAGARSEYVELREALEDLEAEVSKLEGVRDINLGLLPVADMRAAIEDLSRAESDLPILRRSVRELNKRVESAAMKVSHLDKQRRRAEARVASEQAAGVLATSKELAGALRVLGETAALWPNPSSQGSTGIGGQIYTARRDLEALLLTARTMTG